MMGAIAAACITGGIAEAMFSVPSEILETVRGCLAEDLIRVVSRYVLSV